MKWSVQLCGSVTVTQQAVLNTVMKFCGTQTLRIAGTHGRQQATEQTLRIAGTHGRQQATEQTLCIAGTHGRQQATEQTLCNDTARHRN